MSSFDHQSDNLGDSDNGRLIDSLVNLVVLYAHSRKNIRRVGEHLDTR
jgi:hypothetical protein